MSYEVVVVGGGIGGLTTAALLAARGLNVCLLERQPTLGGCAAPFDKFGYRFESGAGLYALWNRGEIHDRIFAELPFPPPEVRPLQPAYVVRLPDRSDVAVSSDSDAFYESIAEAFPECAKQAINFYREAESIGSTLLRAVNRVPDLSLAGSGQRMKAFFPELGKALRVRKLLNQTTFQHLQQTSSRFRDFIDAQLQTLAQCGAEECAYLYACVALTLRPSGLFAMRDGAAGLVDALAQSLRLSGGTVRLNAPALRLAYDSRGQPVGVTLLSGETITASRAIVSNLTVWDTYGKLIGLNNTPSDIRQRLASLTGPGAYLIFAAIQEQAASSLPAEHLLVLSDSSSLAGDQKNATQINFAMAPAWDPRGPAGHRSAVIHIATTADEWFAFHQDATEHESKDQALLERVWASLHASLPELGDALEVIDTMTPQHYYEMTRRKLGMVGGLGQGLDVFGPNAFNYRTHFPNLLMVGDTTFPGAGVAAVSFSALTVANQLTGRS